MEGIFSKEYLFSKSPRFIKRTLVNIEAWRRDRFRRYGNYQDMVAFYDPAWYGVDRKTQESYQLEQLKLLTKVARESVEYYRQNLPDIKIKSLKDIKKLPILSKDIFRKNPKAFIKDKIAINDLWALSTSGSTGTPLRFFLDRSTVRAHQAAIDAIMSSYGCYFGESRVRISGAYVAPYEQTKPPFWIYIDYYKQLQCSAYHLGPDHYKWYIEAMKDFKVKYGTGYATAWYLLGAYILQAKVGAPKLKAIFTDSEGITLGQQSLVEEAFQCPVVQTYGTGETDDVACQCSNKRYHFLTRSSVVEILSDNNEPVKPGETGHVVVTDLTNFITPFIRYRTGDFATLSADNCNCGWQSASLSTIVGRVDDYVVAPDGRKVGRLSHITKPGIGIRESQIVQIALDKIIIKIVPDQWFEESSMKNVLDVAHRLLGNSTNVTWELVDRIERMPSGKLKHVVRKFDIS